MPRYHIYAFLFFNFVAILISQMLGPADVHFNRIEHCDPPVKILEFWMKKWRPNRTVELFNFTINVPYDIDDLVLVTLKASIKKEGGWKPGALYYENTLCKALENMLGETFHEILAQTGHEDCPLPAGNYQVDNYYLNNKRFTVPQVYGDYRMDLLVEKGGEAQACLVLYYAFKPKEE